MSCRPRPPLVVLLITGVCLAGGADTMATAARQNSASGQVGGPTSRLGFMATSGPHGEGLSGTASGHRGGGLGTNLEGSVTCLSVHGYTAVIGGTGTWTSSFAAAGLGPSPVPGPFLIVGVDNSSPRTGQFGEVLPGSPPDRFGEIETTSDCSMASLVPTGRVSEGDVFVRDASDRPPRLTVPRAVRITVSNSRPARVRYRVSATDDFDRHPVARCSPRSGRRFPIGSTLVRCTARDRSGLTRSATFRVHVRSSAR